MEYINIWKYKDEHYPFQIFIGGRGTGKTYSALEGCLNGKIADNKKFILMRRTAQEMDLLLDSDRGEGANPFKPINKTLDRNVGMRSIVKNLAGVYNRELTEEGKITHVGTPIGYGVALSTIASIRGIDFSDVSDCIYDEFIPEKHVRKMKGESDALLNAYETINRNREFYGEKPLGMWLLANSNDIYNEIFIGLELVNIVEKMLQTGKHDKYISDRGLAIHLLESPKEFVEKKSKTALYKLTAGSDFAGMALGNDFAYNDFSLIAHRNLKGYIPVCSIDEGTIYRKKGEREIYISYAQARVPKYTTKTEHEKRRFMADIGLSLYQPFIDGCIIFESYALKAKLLDLIL